MRIAVLGSSTTHQLVELLELFLVGEGINARLFESEYGLFRQELLSPSDELASFKPQIIFIATSGRDIARVPRLGMTPAEVTNAVSEEVKDWQHLWTLAFERWGCTIIQNMFDAPPFTPLGHFGARFYASREHFVHRLNLALSESAPAHVVLHDLPALIREAGTRQWFDPRFYLEAKMPCGPECLVQYAHSVMSLLRAIAGKSKKVLVLDLDNTLWGGVVGDAGPGGIVFGQGSGEGEAYLAFHEFCKSLNERGILLAVCSKNDEDKAREAFVKRTDMPLRLENFSCFTANWIDKAENLRTMAKRLELGIDSFVFVDDNPAERAIVRRFLPTVAVPDLPVDPSGYIEALCKHRYFETVSLTAEDAKRAASYSQNAQRQALEAGSTDIGSFLSSLEMVGRIERVSDVNIERATQLINKSNQFNLTTRRRTLAEVKQLASRDDWRLLTIALADKFGDNGIISVLFLQKCEHRVEIDTWVMSCRVLLRGVEQFALDAIIRTARKLGAATLAGTYIPTERNSMVKDHFSKLGFAKLDGDEQGTTRWTLSIPSHYTSPATFIRLEEQA